MIANSKALDTLHRHPIATVLAVYVLLAVATSHPLATTPTDVLPGSNNSLLIAWMTSWVAQALPATPSDLFTANIFHPDRAALLYSEPLIGVGLLAWPIWMVTGDVVATHNLTFVLTLVLSALSMFLLVREVLGSLVAATVAGVVFAFTTANYDSAARLQDRVGSVDASASVLSHPALAQGAHARRSRHERCCCDAGTELSLLHPVPCYVARRSRSNTSASLDSHGAVRT